MINQKESTNTRKLLPCSLCFDGQIFEMKKPKDQMIRRNGLKSMLLDVQEAQFVDELAIKLKDGTSGRNTVVQQIDS